LPFQAAIGEYGDPLHAAVPFASQHRARSHVRGLPLDLDRAFAGVFRRACCIEQPLAFSIKVTQPIDLQPIGQNTKQEMAGQVRGWSPPKHVLPTDLESTDVEIAQAHDLDIQRPRIRQRRADLDARHARQAARRLDC
jgi:hypothetical protein